MLDPEFEQIVVFTKDGSYQDQTSRPRQNPNLCLAKMKDRATNGYLVCNSAFYTVNMVGSATGTLIRGVLSFGILTVTDAASGNTGFTVSLNKTALDAAVSESGAVQLALLQEYKAAFEVAKSSQQLRNFTSRYESEFDPDALVEKAKENIPAALMREKAYALAQYQNEYGAASTIPDLRKFILKYTQNDPDNLVEMAQVKLEVAESEARKMTASEAERAKKAEAEELLRQEKIRRELVVWRSKLKPGDDTFCGPVIESKPPMVRIALRVQLQGYGNDTWLKNTEIFPSTYGCQNINGRLSPY